MEELSGKIDEILYRFELIEEIIRETYQGIEEAQGLGGSFLKNNYLVNSEN